MTEAPLPEKLVAIHERLDQARIPHAFGGALALAYYAEPRATIDVDLNVFVPPARQADVLAALAPLGVGRGGSTAEELERDGQARWWWGDTPIDVFFANDPIHDAMREAVRTVAFGDAHIPILSPEHLIVCKAAFDRAKDWLDIEQVLVADEHLDHAEIGRWLDRAVGSNDPRRERFERLAGRSPPSSD